MEPSLDAARALLARHFGYPEFRPLQERVVAALLEGRDVLGVLPTGAGKSACFQVPAHLGEGVTLVEWPSRIQPMLPRDRIQIEIQLETDSRRRIEIQPPEGETDRICGGVKDRETAHD